MEIGGIAKAQTIGDLLDRLRSFAQPHLRFGDETLVDNALGRPAERTQTRMVEMGARDAHPSCEIVDAQVVAIVPLHQLAESLGRRRAGVG